MLFITIMTRPQEGENVRYAMPFDTIHKTDKSSDILATAYTKHYIEMHHNVSQCYLTC